MALTDPGPPPSKKCKFCGLTFITATGLNSHQKKLHPVSLASEPLDSDYPWVPGKGASNAHPYTATKKPPKPPKPTFPTPQPPPSPPPTTPPHPVDSAHPVDTFSGPEPEIAWTEAPVLSEHTIQPWNILKPSEELAFTATSHVKKTAEDAIYGKLSYNDLADEYAELAGKYIKMTDVVKLTLAEISDMKAEFEHHGLVEPVQTPMENTNTANPPPKNSDLPPGITIVCKTCDKAFYNIPDAQEHAHEHLDTEQLEELELCQCAVCGLEFDPVTLDDHMTWHAEQHPTKGKCALCNKYSPNLLNHICKDKKPVILTNKMLSEVVPYPGAMDVENITAWESDNPNMASLKKWLEDHAADQPPKEASTSVGMVSDLDDSELVASAPWSSQHSKGSALDFFKEHMSKVDLTKDTVKVKFTDVDYPGQMPDNIDATFEEGIESIPSIAVLDLSEKTRALLENVEPEPMKPPPEWKPKPKKGVITLGGSKKAKAQKLIEEVAKVKAKKKAAAQYAQKKQLQAELSAEHILSEKPHPVDEVPF